MSCTRPKYAIQFLSDGLPKQYEVNGKVLKEKLKFFNFRETLIIRSKDNGNLSHYMARVNPQLVENVDFRCLYLPCGECSSCRLNYAKQWSIRGLMELMSSRYHHWNADKTDYIDLKSTFLTLTIDDEHLKSHGVYVQISVLQKFLKRLRKELSYKNLKIRYLACGEYGEEYDRPHYHLIIFGWFPDDVDLFNVNSLGDKVFISPTLSKLWPLGHHFIGDVTAESIAYVAGYVSKKQTAKNYLSKKNLPFITMSRKPGLGFDFFNDFQMDFINDSVRVGDKVYQVPRYFMKWFEKHRPDIFNDIKNKRLEASKSRFDLTLSTGALYRLDEFYNLRLRKKVRNYEN